MDPFDDINEYYRNNPPERVLDDIGIFHPVEIPLPSKYEREPCACGIIHSWENPETFRLHSSLPGILDVTAKKCKTCDQTLTLKLYKGDSDEVV